jgi:hypothetical protein
LPVFEALNAVYIEIFAVFSNKEDGGKRQARWGNYFFPLALVKDGIVLGI